MLNFRFTERYGEHAFSQFFDITLLSELFPQYILSLVEGKSVGHADVFCYYYDPDDFDLGNEPPSYEGVEFSVLDMEDTYPPQIIDCSRLYDLLEQACQFHVEDHPEEEGAKELLAFVQKKKAELSASI